MLVSGELARCHGAKDTEKCSSFCSFVDLSYDRDRARCDDVPNVDSMYVTPER